MPSDYWENASLPQAPAKYHRSESLPAAPSDGIRPIQPTLPQHMQCRYPAPGYWPMSYNMQMWAGLPMQQYMMDTHQSDHGTGKQQHLCCMAPKGIFKHYVWVDFLKYPNIILKTAYSPSNVV